MRAGGASTADKFGYGIGAHRDVKAVAMTCQTPRKINPWLTPDPPYS